MTLKPKKTILYLACFLQSSEASLLDFFPYPEKIKYIVVMFAKGINSIKISALIYLFFSLCLLFLLYLICTSPTKFIADERDFFPNIKVLEQYGMSFAFLNNIKGQSPGPLYQYIYHSLSYIMPLTPRNMRLVNFAFLLSNLYFLYLLISYHVKKHALLIALLFLAVPMAWSISGVALTEMPTFFFSFLSMLFLKNALAKESKASIILSIIGGLCAGTAIIGRSPYLMVIPPVLLFFSLPGKKLCITLFVLFAMLFPALVFYAWKGLVPPDVQNIQSGYQAGYVLLAFMYFAIATVIIYPGFFAIKKGYYYSAVLIIFLSFIFNMFFAHIKYMPFRGMIGLLKIIPPSTGESAEYVFPSLILGVVFIFFISLYAYIIKNRQDVWSVFMLIISLLIVFTTIKSSAHFTSKYVMQAYPFFLVYIAANIKINKYLLLRAIIGVAIGIMSLKSVYIIHDQLPYQPMGSVEKQNADGIYHVSSFNSFSLQNN